MTKQRQPASTIPKFRTHEEQADFWDTHSPEDFPGEFEEVDDVIIVPDIADIPPGSPARKRFISRLAELPPDKRLAVALFMLGMDKREIARIVEPAKPRAKHQRATRAPSRTRQTRVKSKA
jgi:predicted RNA polymerase sigma factor